MNRWQKREYASIYNGNKSINIWWNIGFPVEDSYLSLSET